MLDIHRLTSAFGTRRRTGRDRTEMKLLRGGMLFCEGGMGPGGGEHSSLKLTVRQAQTSRREGGGVPLLLSLAPEQSP